MFRRRFLQMLTLASASPLIAVESLAAGATNTVTYHVTGFTCITCATGLDTMLGRHKGIKSSASTYPQGIVKITFNPDQVTEQWIEGFIADLGFKAAQINQK